MPNLQQPILKSITTMLLSEGTPGSPYDPTAAAAAAVSKMLGGPPAHQAYAADLSGYGPMYAPYYKQAAVRPGPYPAAYGRPSPYYCEYPAMMGHHPPPPPPPHLPR